MKPETPDEFIRRYRNVAGHIISESLGYATVTNAGRIGLDGLHDRPNYCEWIDHCYKGNARQALKDAIKNRHHHKGPMADYKYAKMIVDRYIESGKQPDFASWF